MIYIVQEPRPEWYDKNNLDGVAKKGEHKFVLMWNDVYGLSNEDLIERVKTGLRNFTRDDYLLPLGSNLAIAIATAYVSSRLRGRLPLLMWSMILRNYEEVIIDINSTAKKNPTNASNR